MRRHAPAALSVVAICVVFWWIYGRFAGRFYFVLDDTIETYAALSRPLAQAIADSFNGQINWSGYRPISYASRALMSHIFALDRVIGYYLVSLGLHLANTLMLFALARTLLRHLAWAFIAAMIFMLLPAHNEAVLYMSANANLIALFFCLISLLASLTPPRRPARGWWDALSVSAYLLAVLAYEVTLPLPFFVVLADWRKNELSRRRAPLYLGYGIAIVIALALRVWASGGRLTPDRADYTISLAPLHLLQGYAILLGQMILLHTSAWIGLPLYSNVREWMSPLNPRALVAMALTVIGSLAVLTLALRTHPPTSDRAVAPQRRVDLFWVAWGLLWLAAMSVLFAALAGRFPENRYTYIPSLGLSVALGALTGWIYVVLARRPIFAGAWLGLVVALLAGYAYVSTSDVSAWERASQHTRSLMQGALERLPILQNQGGVALVGMPGVVGNVFTFNTEESFHAAVQMLYGVGVGKTWASDLMLRRALSQDADLGAEATLLAYDRNAHAVHLAERAVLCTEMDKCRAYSFQKSSASAPAWVYWQTYRQDRSQEGGLAMLFELTDKNAPALASCWAFYDLKAAQIDPAQFDNAALAARCEQVAAQITESDVLTVAPVNDERQGAP